MHSGVLIFVWTSGVVVLQILSGKWLLIAVGSCVLGALLGAPARANRLFRRVRFLVLAIVVFFAGFTPGEALLATWPQWSPSREGVMLAVQHAARLVGVVACVALLLERLPIDRLVSGLYALLRPVEFVGLPAARLALRLLLVLRYVEAGPRRSWTHWLGDSFDPPDEIVRIERERLRPLDLILSASCVALVVATGVAG